MIKYKLACDSCEISFDSWFAGSNEYEKLKKKKLLICHNCGSKNIRKTIMAPKLISSQNKSKEQQNIVRHNIIKKTIKNYQKFIKDNFKYVGNDFVYEARTIHYDKKEKTKGIYGNATKEDIQELKEEGIETQIIPWLEAKDN